MATKKIRIRPEGINDYSDILHPETSADIVLSTDGNVQTDIDSLKTNKADKTQVLTNVPLNAKFTDTIYSHPTSAGNKHIPTGGSVGQILKNTSSGTATWQNENITPIANNLTTTATGSALDATQGKALDDKIGILNGVGELQEKANKSDLDAHKEDGASHSKTARFVIGTSTAGWTEKDVDYLCDGTDDHIEINQAIQSLPTNGGEVIMLEGIYSITDSILIGDNNITIRGNGDSTTLKRMYDLSDVEGIITLNGANGCKISDFQIDGNKTNFTSFYNVNLYLRNSSNNIITGFTSVYSSSLGIFLDEGSNNNVVTGNKGSNNGRGISLANSTNNTITGNSFNDNASDGISLADGSLNNTLTGNTCNNNKTGISTSGANHTITGNTCNHNESTGILILNTNNSAITGNCCIRGTGLIGDYTSTQYTIRLMSGNNYNLISNNNCMGKDVTNGGGTGNTIIDNKWSNSSGRILESYSEKLSTVNPNNGIINLDYGSVFQHTASINRVYTITNPASSVAQSFTLIINMGPIVRTLTFPSSVKWQGGEIPDLSTASKTYVLTFMTVNGGTTWLGMFGGEF